MGSLSRAFEQPLLSHLGCQAGTDSLRAGGTPRKSQFLPQHYWGFIGTFSFVPKADLVTPYPSNCGITSHRTLLCAVLPQIQQMADEAATEMDKLLAAKTKELLG